MFLSYNSLWRQNSQTNTIHPLMYPIERLLVYSQNYTSIATLQSENILSHQKEAPYPLAARLLSSLPASSWQALIHFLFMDFPTLEYFILGESYNMGPSVSGFLPECFGGFIHAVACIHTSSF